jgi:hypothetical protein
MTLCNARIQASPPLLAVKCSSDPLFQAPTKDADHISSLGSVTVLSVCPRRRSPGGHPFPFVVAPAQLTVGESDSL